MKTEKCSLFHKGQGSSKWGWDIGPSRFVYVIAFSVRRSSFGWNRSVITRLASIFLSESAESK